MNLRPPGYEPGELPGCSTPRRGGHDSTALSLVALALVVAVAAPVVGIVYAARGGLGVFRDFRALMRALGSETSELSQKLEQLAAFEPPDLDRASASFDRLQRDRARLQILLGALGRAREQFSAFATVYPRK